MENLRRRLDGLENKWNTTLGKISSVLDEARINNDHCALDPRIQSSKSGDEEMGTNTPGQNIWPLLVDWLTEKDTEGNRRSRFGKWLKLIDARNTRQLLFTRELKGREKYGNGLSLSDSKGLEDATKRLADSVFLLVKSCKERNRYSSNELGRQVTLLTDLHNVIGNLIMELKSNPNPTSN